jgi:hypothetical protein
LDDGIPFGEGQELIVNIDVNVRGTNHIYIDYLVLLLVEIEGLGNLF